MKTENITHNHIHRPIDLIGGALIIFIPESAGCGGPDFRMVCTSTTWDVKKMLEK
jgi:hypothetical protein